LPKDLSDDVQGLANSYQTMGRDTVRYIVLTCAFLITGEAVATEVTIGQAKLTLVAPKGFCPLEPRNSVDSELISFAQRAVQGRNEVLGLYVDCQRLGPWRAGEIDHIGEVFSYQVSLRMRNLTASAQTDIPSMCAAFRKQGAAIVKDAERITAANVKGIKEFADKIELNSTHMYGVLHEDKTGCYFGTVQKYKVEDNVETTFSAKIVTVVKSKMVFAEHEGFYKDENVVKRLLATSRETVAALLARNR
jgi:hypothetical protein